MKAEAKAKVTVSINPSILAIVDQAVLKDKALSRSAVVEEALRHWHREHKRKALDAETEEYYLSLTEEERNEDRLWSNFSSKPAIKLWEK